MLKDFLLEARVRFAHSQDETKQGYSKSFEDSFFNVWFESYERRLYFLFNTNLAVTDLQMAELFSLIRRHTRLVDGYDIDFSQDDIHFSTISGFKESLREVLANFEYLEDEERFDIIDKLYRNLFFRSIVVDIFHGSCTMFFPPVLKVDLKRVCAESGYVHSCGTLIYAQNIDTADKGLFFRNLEKHIGGSKNSGMQTFFCAYSHDDFTAYDRTKSDILRNGLDEVKIHLDKLYMGPERLVSVLQELRDRFLDRIVVPFPGDFREQHRKSIETNQNLDRDSTIWLVTDKGVDKKTGLAHPTNRYYICYDQQYINVNQFHIFDENKPGWLDHTTISHKLAAAMVNIALPPDVDSRTEKLSLIDPFAGSGTFVFESQKHRNVVSFGSDLSALSARLVKDNIYWMSTSVNFLDQLLIYLRDVSNFLQKVIDQPRTIVSQKNNHHDLFNAVTNTYQLATDILLYQKASDLDEKSEKVFCTRMGAMSKKHRILVYIWLRTLIRRAPAIERKAERSFGAFCKEAAGLIKNFDEFRSQKQLIEQETIEDDGNILVYRARYSKGCCISDGTLSGYFSRIDNDYDGFSTNDVSELGQDTYDIIVTDPPYGFNTEEDPVSLAQLYDRFLISSIRSLRNEGNLMICLLDKPYTGRKSFTFASPRFVTKQVLDICSRLNKECFRPARRMPNINNLFQPPYYWESDRALRRRILHFRIRNKS